MIKTLMKLIYRLCKKEKFPLVFILGPTGVGKTKLSIELGQYFQSEIISADSMQVRFY